MPCLEFIKFQFYTQRISKWSEESFIYRRKRYSGNQTDRLRTKDMAIKDSKYNAIKDSK